MTHTLLYLSSVQCGVSRFDLSHSLQWGSRPHQRGEEEEIQTSERLLCASVGHLTGVRLPSAAKRGVWPPRQCHMLSVSVTTACTSPCRTVFWSSSPRRRPPPGEQLETTVVYSVPVWPFVGCVGRSIAQLDAASGWGEGGDGGLPGESTLQMACSRGWEPPSSPT